MANSAVVISVLANTAKAQKSIDDLSSRMSKLGGTFSKIGTGVAVGAGALVAGLGVTIKAASESQKVAAQTAAVIKSTGDASQRTAKQMSDYAGKLSMISGVDDEVIQSGENLLATFTNIKGKAFDKATKAALDMSTAMGTDLNSSVLQLGKALNDPVAGVTKLQKVGVTFTQQQKDQIASYVKLGQTAKAQGVILAEVNKEFGGSAKAAGDTAEGSLNKLKVQLGNIQENIGSAFLPLITKVFTPLAKSIADFANGPALKAFTDWASKSPTLVLGIVGGIAGLAVALKAAGAAMQAWSTITKIAAGVQAAFNFVLSANPIGLVVIAIAALVAGLVLFFTKTKLGQAIVQDAFGGISTAIHAVTDWWTGSAGPAIGKTWDKVTGFFATAKRDISAAMGVIGGVIRAVWAYSPIGIVTSNWGKIIDFFKGIPGTVKGIFKSAGSWLKDAGRNIIEGLKNGVLSLAGGIGDWIVSKIPKPMVAAVKKALGIHSPSRVFHQLGAYTVQGLVNGLNSGQGSIAGAMAGLSGTVGGGYSASIKPQYVPRASSKQASMVTAQLSPYDRALLQELIDRTGITLDARTVGGGVQKVASNDSNRGRY
jgi:hypothetical protein